MNVQTNPEQALWEARMLSGEPFTYGQLCARRRATAAPEDRFKHDDHDRLIDRTIQKLRRKGLIAFTREGSKVVWRAVSEPTQ